MRIKDLIFTEGFAKHVHQFGELLEAVYRGDAGGTTLNGPGKAWFRSFLFTSEARAEETTIEPGMGGRALEVRAEKMAILDGAIITDMHVNKHPFHHNRIPRKKISATFLPVKDTGFTGSSRGPATDPGLCRSDSR